VSGGAEELAVSSRHAMATAAYVYCVVRSARKPAVARIPPGVPGADTPVVEKLGNGLWLVTASVPLDRYGSEPLDASLRDFEWVAQIALAHEAVVEYFVRSKTTVIPTKLFTMFSNRDRAVAEMQARRGDLERVFERIEGCEEWGVRVTRRETRAGARRPAQPRTGAAFLAARKQARDQARDAVRAAAEAADVAFDSLSEIARARKRRTDETAGAAPPLLDAAFLVPARRRARFHAVAERLAKDVAKSGARMTLTGPWPPYNFIDTTVAEEGA
jgi:Gas vesicle synthesis protein GvpL/GvpF